MMKKVVILVPSFENKGPIIVAKNIADCMKKDIKCIFVSLKKNTNIDLKSFSNFEYYELNLSKIPIFSLKLKRIIENLKPDIIHCHCFWPTVLAGIYLKKFKIISTLHNNPLEDFYYEYGKILSIFMIRIMIFFQKQFYLNVSISNYIKGIHEELGLGNVFTIYNGIPELNFSKNIKNEIKDKKLKLITISVLNKIKNVSFLLEVIKKLKDENIKIELKIVGDGNEKNNLKNYVQKNNLQNEVIFLGRLSREKVYEELKQADIFLFSSLNEGFGLVITEALWCNTPVVVSNIPVMREVVINNKNGIICNLNVQEYVNAILEINKNLDFFKNNTKKYFNKDFLAENMSENYRKIYVKIMRE